jgi:hypothetical protein
MRRNQEKLVQIILNELPNAGGGELFGAVFVELVVLRGTGVEAFRLVVLSDK